MELVEFLGLAVIWYVVFVFSTVLHEAAHAWAALMLGDRTAYHGGQVSLDPLPHMQREPLGMIVMPLLTFVLNGGYWMFGWASAPYDLLWALRYPKRAGWMALAGPVANLLLVLVATIGIWIGLGAGAFEKPTRLDATSVTIAANGGLAHAFAITLSIAFTLNLVLAVFNLLPLPPLDGSAVIMLFMDFQTVRKYQEILYQPVYQIIGILIAWNVFSPLFQPIFLRVVLVLLYQDFNFANWR